MGMQQTWRWFGPNDPVTLADIRQVGATGIVHALHHLPIGEVWPVDEIRSRKLQIEREGLHWSIVESVPVHEDIKTRQGNYDEYITAYQQTIRNLANSGISTICYNFMPVLDWTRTSLDYKMSDGSTALYFDINVLAAFDLFILKRYGAESFYSKKEQIAAEKHFKQMTETDKNQLRDTILSGLPGSEEGYSLDQFRSALNRYLPVDHFQLKKNLRLFLEAIIPIAEAVGIRMAIHPDDPPRPLFGLPRVMSTEKDLIDLLQMVDSPNNGLTMCTGSYGAHLQNDLVGMINRHGSKIHFVHLRSTQFVKDKPGCFYEANHLEGNTDMYGIVRALVEEQKRRVRQGRLDHQIPMRPDHGHDMLDDLRRESNPGYSCIGRMRGLAELRGLEMGIERSLQT